MKRRIVVLLTVVLMVLATLVSGTPGFSQPPIPPGVEKLRQDAVGEVDITWNPRIGTLSFIRGRIPLRPVDLKEKVDPATVVLAFVGRYGEVFGLEDPKAELEVVGFVTDELGMTHVTLRQVYQGIEVYNAQVKVHLSADGKEVVAVSSGFVPGIRLPDTQPRISADQALATARKVLPNGTLLSDPKLVVYPGTGEATGAGARLAWLVELRDDAIPARNVYVVDALQGDIVEALNRLYDAPIPAGNRGIRGAGTVTNTESIMPSLLKLPFSLGETWYVCQGYNGTISHASAFALDLTVRHGDVGTNGCWASDGNVSASAGRTVQAPGAGNVTYIGSDLVCLTFDAGGSMVIGHMANRVAAGHVVQNQSLGTVALAGDANGGYSHIHVQIHSGAGCAASGGTIPFDDAHGTRFQGAPNLPDFGGVNQYRGVALTRVRLRTYNANHNTNLPGTLARSNDQGPTGDADVDHAHDFAADTYNYFQNTHSRDSYDNQGAIITSTAHYGRNYLNAFWNGEQMVYGDGFPVNDIVAHELSHAVTEHSANLEYKWQSGALNESFSDIFGAMVDRDDWLMGEDLPPNVLAGREAIRDLSDPPRFGQPDHTDDWVETCSDNEGVHTNSGIPNKAFYNIATAIGKDKAEQIFYRTLIVYLDTESSLEDARAAALQSAGDLYGSGSAEYNAVRDGFNAVGLDGQWNPPPNDCVCAAMTALSDETVYSDRLSALEVAATLYGVRDQLLDTRAAGRHYRTLYEQHAGRISYLLLFDSTMRATGGQILKEFTPGLKQLVNGHGDESVVTQKMVTDVISFLRRLADEDRGRGGDELAQTIKREMARIDWDHLIGMTFEEAWVYISSRITVHS